MIRLKKYSALALLSTLLLSQLSGCGTEVVGAPDLLRSSEVSARVTAQNAALEDQPKPSAALFTFEPGPAISVSSTSSRGFAQLSGLLPLERKLVFAGAAGSALQAKVVHLRESESLGFLDFSLLRLQVAGCVPINSLGCPGRSTGPTFNLGDYELTLRPGQLERDLDEPPFGDVNVYITPIEVLEQRYFPGRFESEQGELEAFAAVHLQAQDNISANRPEAESLDRTIGADLVQLSPGETAQVRLAATANAPATATLYAYDLSTGYWLPESTLTLDAATQTYSGVTSKLGYLAAMTPIAQTQSLSSCVIDENANPISFAQVAATGLNYGSKFETRAGEDGRFSLQVKAGEPVELLIRAGVFDQRMDLPVSQFNSTECMQIDTQSEIDLTVLASWNSNPDFRLNVLFPDGRFESLAEADVGSPDTFSREDGAGLITQVVRKPGSNQLDYFRLMKGRHLIAINRAFDAANTSITQAAAQVSIAGQRFTPPAGEQVNNASLVNQNRTTVWLAAEVWVQDDCSVLIRDPSEVPSAELGGFNYDPWIERLSEFYEGKVFEGSSSESNALVESIEYCDVRV